MDKQLPKGWIITDLQNVVNNKKGKKPKVLNADSFKDSVPYLDIKAFEKNEIRQYADRKSAYVIDENCVAIVWDGARSGWTAKGKIGALGSTLAAMSPIIGEVDYLYYYLQSQYEYINKNPRGIGIPHVDPSKLWTLPFPLTPLPEQKRIADKLDTIFGHMDIVKAGLVRIPELLKKFRQQVLTQAVTGKLTEEWRGSKGIDKIEVITIGELYSAKPKGWSWEQLIDIATLESGHTPRKTKPEYWDGGTIPWICLQDIRAAHGKVLYETKYMPTQLGIDNSSSRILPKGTVCFSRDISVGYTTIMGRDMATTQHFANWICGDKVYNRFLMYAFMASKDSLTASGTGTTVGTIYMPALKKLTILLPPLAEQKEIVKRVDALFAIADKIQAQYESLQKKAAALPQAILSKAFRGELVPQNPSDEPASELLKRIAKEKKKK